jgi:hypothetical protein
MVKVTRNALHILCICFSGCVHLCTQLMKFVGSSFESFTNTYFACPFLDVGYTEERVYLWLQGTQRDSQQYSV